MQLNLKTLFESLQLNSIGKNGENVTQPLFSAECVCVYLKIMYEGKKKNIFVKYQVDRGFWKRFADDMLNFVRLET